MVNPPRCKILHKKASLAVLQRRAQRRAVRRRGARGDRRVRSRGRASSRSARRVHDGTRGRSAAVHRRQSRAARAQAERRIRRQGHRARLGSRRRRVERAITIALAEPYIVQQRIALPTEPYPSSSTARCTFIDRMVDTAPYVAYGDHVDGCLTRLATASLLNVTAGGGSQTPTFIARTAAAVTHEGALPHTRHRRRVPDHRSGDARAPIVHHRDPRRAIT